MAEQNEAKDNEAGHNEAEQKEDEHENKPVKRGRWSCLDTIPQTTNPASLNESEREEEGPSACTRSTGRNNYGASSLNEGNFVVEGQTDVGNWSWKFLVVLSAFFLRMTIDGTHYASGIFEGEIKKELGLQTFQIVIVGCCEVTVCSAASYQAAKLTEIIHPRFVALARSILAIEGWLIGAAANGFWLLFVGKIVLGGGLGLMYFPATLEPAEFFSGTGRTMATAFIDAGSGAGQVTRFIKKKTLSHYPLSILISMSSLPIQPQSIKQKSTLRS